MTNEIAPILAELRQDHRNMAKLLTLLEQQTELVFDKGNSQVELMVDIMRYMTVYPDTVHHPNEDSLYAELRAARPDLSQGMARVTDDHDKIADQSIELRDKLETMASGDTVPRKELVAGALRYIKALRQHMDWEESDLFRRLDKMVADGHELIEASTIVRRQDPLYGPAVGEQFQALHEAVDN